MNQQIDGQPAKLMSSEANAHSKNPSQGLYKRNRADEQSTNRQKSERTCDVHAHINFTGLIRAIPSWHIVSKQDNKINISFSCITTVTSHMHIYVNEASGKAAGLRNIKFVNEYVNAYVWAHGLYKIYRHYSHKAVEVTRNEIIEK
uniref:Uncharacterized protein n=1 Tax=Glossina pallidipes TaxID=7398 RepID=A0A1B0A3Z3_GLOPL